MVSVHDKWIRIFDIPDVRKHKNGFTIYKVVSMLYPESCPDAVTRVIVWKRFNDFRRLNRELEVLYKKTTKNKDFPSLPAKTVLKRFEDETIQERKQSVLNFLEFIGGNSQLFTSKEFVKFLEISYTPAEHLNSNINSIRAELQLPEDPEVSTTLSEDDITISDTDSISTMCSFNCPTQVDVLTDITKSHLLNNPKLQKFNSTTSINSHTSSNNSDLSNVTNIFDSISLLDGQGHNIPFIKSLDDNIQYILDASVHINLAAELEEERKFLEAHIAYNTAIAILVKHGIEDTNYDRRQLVKYKVDKYKIRAEKIYNMYLSPEMRDLQFMTEPIEEAAVKTPSFDLYKYKVVKIVNSSGILVLHSELQKLFYIKIIQKTTQFLHENLILPENVPYMVKLDSHYNCENAVFLVLEYCSGMKLSDYLKRQVDDPTFNKTSEIITCQFQDESDNESDQSFSELINDYNNHRMASSSQTLSSKDYFDDDKRKYSSDGSFEKIDMEDGNVEKAVSGHIPDHDEPQTSSDSVFTDQNFHQQKYTRRKDRDFVRNISSDSRKQSTTSSQRSQFSSFDTNIFTNRVVVPDKIVVKWTAQLLVALDKLHTLGVICRDLQINNLLIDESDNLVLTYMCNIKELSDLFSTSINYNLAPEVYSFHQITNAADWYSFGAILYELLVGQPLTEVHINGLNSCKCLRIPKYVSPEGRSILKQLLTYDPNDRLGSGINGTENIKSHPFFKSVSWEALI